jgi:hypothetical protein
MWFFQCLIGSHNLTRNRQCRFHQLFQSITPLFICHLFFFYNPTDSHPTETHLSQQPQQIRSHRHSLRTNITLQPSSHGSFVLLLHHTSCPSATGCHEQESTQLSQCSVYHKTNATATFPLSSQSQRYLSHVPQHSVSSP